ncbi:MAG TPA: 30S ribosomal protein S2, partial [Acidimicrobiia bacterium]|nr:30S ribosomal protein S2 [Acidimicrobiia bacterium]
DRSEEEHIAIHEATRLGIPIVALVDTNCDPEGIDYVIPGNDDAIRSAQLMCRVISDAVNEGRELARRRGARPGTRADDNGGAQPAEAPKPQRSAEEQAEFERRQGEARAAAAAKQREIEERARAARAKPDADAETTASDETGTADATPEAENG